MVEIATVKMSSKGQIVIPSNFRNNFKVGDEILLIKDENRIILKNKNYILSQSKEDLDFAKETEKAYEQYKKGKYTSFDFDDGIEEMKKW